MNIDRRVLVAGIAATGAAACAPSTAASDAVDPPALTPTVNFVLVHGAWHGGWCWRDVRSVLEAAGHNVTTPTLTGLGERAHLLTPDVGLDTHIQDVVAHVEMQELNDIVLVGHSYGGMVVTGAADRLRERIRHLVYLDAAVPKDGQSMITQGPPTTPEAVEQLKASLEALAPDGVGMTPFPPTLLGVPETDLDAIAWLERRMTPHPLKTWLDPIVLREGGAEALPRTYIHCVAPALQQSANPFHAAAARESDAWRFAELQTGHEAMITAPEETANLLLEAAFAGP